MDAASALAALAALWCAGVGRGVCALEHPRCEEITIPMCRGIGYNLTAFPNALDHDTQEEAGLECLCLDETHACAGDVCDGRTGYSVHEVAYFIAFVKCGPWVRVSTACDPGPLVTNAGSQLSPDCQTVCEANSRDGVAHGTLWLTSSSARHL
ncbi:Frizzled-5 [Eumeta japonica]|uniref:Frizzled-5 n=1 Tax=Eumeta variegata TaxID=151549 RepID=A0A4C1V4W7_EUMVA|nr:Frizzled-5 [Eumeta japonica]